MKPVQRVKSWNKGSKDQEENQSSYISPSRYKMSPYLTIYFTRTETISDEGSSTATVTVTATTTATASASCDQYWNNTVFLCHFNGTNNQTGPYTDNAAGDTIISTFSTAKLVTAEKYFGTASLYLDGSGYVKPNYPSGRNPTYDLGTISSSTDFTIEFYTKKSAINSTYMVFAGHALPGSGGDGIGGWNVYTQNSGYIGFTASKNSSAGTAWFAQFQTNSAVLTSTSVWYHIAIVISSGVPKIFVNGTEQASSFQTPSAIYASSLIGLTTTKTNYGLIVGAGDSDSGNAINSQYIGYIDDLRITTNVARYTSNFTVPVVEYPDVACESDTYFSSVSLLMPMNGVSGSTNFIDYSSLSNSITVNGNSSISPAKYKWGGSSGLFDGTTDWLYAPVGSVNFGTGNFTIEGWFNWASLTNGGLFQVYPGTPPNTTAGVAVGYDGTDFQIYSGNANYTRSYTPTTNTWYHVALVRNSSLLTLYVNGVAQGASLTDTTNYGGNGINVGLYYGSGYTFNGNINDFRVTTGVARYTANFTPPTASFPLS